jgi:hypothetical protein
LVEYSRLGAKSWHVIVPSERHFFVHVSRRIFAFLPFVYHRSLSIRVTPAFFAHAFSRHRTKAALAVLGNGAERDLPIVEGIEDRAKASAAAYQVTAP